MSELPKGWESVKLPEFAEIIMGQSPASSDCNDFGDGLPFFQGKAEFQKLHPIARKYCTNPKKLAKEKDILLSVRAPVGPTNVASEDCVIGRGLASIRAFEQEDSYLLHYFRSIEPWMSQQGTGSTFKAISGQFLKELEVKVAPLPEQKRIVEKLDEVLAQVDTIKARLDGIPDLLKRFRQSVLASAVSGNLTLTEPKSHSLIGEVAKVIGGLTKNSKRTTFERKLPYLRVANVYENELRLDDVAEIGVLDKELDRTLLSDGDILVVEGNGSIDQIGRVAMWDNSISPCVHQNHLIKVRANLDMFLPKYVLYYLMSPQGKSEIVERATSGAGLYTLSISKISSISIPVFSIGSQKEIVRLVDQYFAFADTIEAQVKKAQARVDNLTQSILAKAFRGELVPQDPNDEPADKLLERIAQARAEAEVLAKAAKKAQAAKKRAVKA